MHDIDLDAYTPPNPYERDLAALRAASATPESRFENDYRAARRRAFEAEYAAAALRTAEQPASRVTNLVECKPPDPYREGIRLLREKR
jgi:hypothetical protein